MKNILQFLEKSAIMHPDKIIFADADTSVSYSEFLETAQAIGTAIAQQGIRNRPVAVLMPRCVQALTAMM